MGTKQPLLGSEDNENHENSQLLDEGKASSSKYEESAGSFRARVKLIIAGFSILGLIVLGIIIGAVLGKENHEEKGIGLYSRGENFPYRDIRLPANLLPLKYRVYLHPNITNNVFDFKGFVRIVVQCQSDTDSVILNMKGLTVHTAKLFKGEALEPAKDMNYDTVPLKDYINSDKYEFLMLRVNDSATLVKDEKYTIYVKYEGKLSVDVLEGFYRSSYKTKNGETRYVELA